VERFRGGLVFKAHRFMYHSTLGSRVIKKKKKVWWYQGLRGRRTAPKTPPSRDSQCTCFRVWGHGCGVQGQGSGFKFWGLGVGRFRVQGYGTRVSN